MGPTPMGAPVVSRPKQQSLLSFLAWLIFSISVFLAMGMFGYRYYLKYSIAKLSMDLETARANLQSDTIRELTRADNRINSTRTLTEKHRVITPLFAFLKETTPKTVRFTQFHFLVEGGSVKLNVKGEAKNYAALAFQADSFNKSGHFTNPLFSHLTLNDRGDVLFSFKSIINPELVSYNSQLK